MPTDMQSRVRNRLLAAIPAESFACLAPHLTSVELSARQLLVEDRVPLRDVHFLESGLASMVATSRHGAEEIEVGHIGREGMTGFHVLHGVDHTPHRTFMQTGGAALRTPAAVLTKIAASDEPLRRILLRYVHCYEIQLSYSALANGRYNINERLARWLLMSQDRLGSDSLPLTHEFLSLMLGVRRSGVTNEVHVLEGARLIKATRGRIHILDRRGLEKIAAGCYGIPEDEYERLIGAPSLPADPGKRAP
ncbi:Crp/Fnr family transcriptional regulator [Aureimonas flava]|uniref:Crp/Fnr family transcriptional regulator n=1 Tax=Aureimonas flava TaxID=2320271 RepID=A0A3A1WMX9_9HYPH|nr:Crp/Fnr family transcriptional regulator [Aureimonas flava]RIY03247.1 Crp/Fnr family transcriptional regulator [Aureimonas flava]